MSKDPLYKYIDFKKIFWILLFSWFLFKPIFIFMSYLTIGLISEPYLKSMCKVINKYTPSLKYFGLLYLGIEGLIFSEFEIYNGVKLIQLEDIKSLILLCMFMSIGIDVIMYALKNHSEIRQRKC
jgi:hypothetical protein